MSGLKEINHIVVLMLENRSFDHMLGYLRLKAKRADVDGLTGNETNEYPKGTPHKPQLSSESSFSPDPNHDWDNVHAQLDNNNAGFIADFASLKPKPQRPERVMHYQDAGTVPSLDHLAKEFCVCDRWFSSIPGATQPNRMYALAGESGGKKNNLPTGKLLTGGWKVKPIYEFLPKTVSWRHYSHDIASLRFIKGYQGFVAEIDKVNKFYEHAQQGTLANVSWIDPDFGTLLYPGPPNDDHPPHDIANGQNLVRKVYNALLNGPKSQWERTMLVVVYDEHGGFYDHVSPRQWGATDDRVEFRQFGVRVPALVVSPWVGRKVAYGSKQNVVFDHTSILQTILKRFATSPNAPTPKMTARVTAANDLGVLLSEAKPRTDCTAIPALPFKIAWEDRFMLLESTEPGIGPRLVRRPPSELEQSMQALAEKAIAQGVPPDKL
jgi:phospholipase C